MVLPLLVPAGGVLTWAVPEGAVLGAGELIARLALDEGCAVAAPERYTGGFPELAQPRVLSSRVDALLGAGLDAATALLAGYVVEPEQASCPPRAAAVPGAPCYRVCGLLARECASRGLEAVVVARGARCGSGSHACAALGSRRPAS